MSLGKRLKLIRKDTGETQAKFAKRLGKSEAAYKSYERDVVVPDNSIIKLMVVAMNVDETWLRTGEGDMFKKNNIEMELARVLRPLLEGSEQGKVRLKLVTQLIKFIDRPEVWDTIIEMATMLVEELNKGDSDEES